MRRLLQIRMIHMIIHLERTPQEILVVKNIIALGAKMSDKLQQLRLNCNPYQALERNNKLEIIL